MKVEQESPPTRRKVRLWVLIGLPLLVLAVFGILRFGNPQWCRWVYVFQTYVSPKHPSGRIESPSGYTGTWATWRKNGRKWSHVTFKDGRMHGPFFSYWDNGRKAIEGRFKDGVEDGMFTYWDREGESSAVREYRNGVSTPVSGSWGRSEKGKGYFTDHYEDGWRVKTELHHAEPADEH